MQTKQPKKEKTDTMRAIILDDFDSSPGLRQDLPAPTPADNEVLVRVSASFVNPVDNSIAILRRPEGSLYRYAGRGAGGRGGARLAVRRSPTWNSAPTTFAACRATSRPISLPKIYLLDILALATRWLLHPEGVFVHGLVEYFKRPSGSRAGRCPGRRPTGAARRRG
jgi:hypothetical protein